MKEVELKILPVKVIWIFLSIMLILNGCLWLLSHIDRLSVFNIIYPVFAVGSGIYFLAGGAEIDKLSLRTKDKSVLINWHGWIRRKEIKFDDIRVIYLRRYEVVIIKPQLKVMKLRIDTLEVAQKKAIYDFFTELSKEESLVLERQFDL